MREVLLRLQYPLLAAPEGQVLPGGAARSSSDALPYNSAETFRRSANSALPSTALTRDILEHRLEDALVVSECHVLVDDDPALPVGASSTSASVVLKLHSVLTQNS